jgi:hypothetical protein
MNLVDILYNNRNILKYNLNNQQQELIYRFIKCCPSQFDNLNNNIKNITSDGVININDIPMIIHLIANFYNDIILIFKFKSLKPININTQDVIIFIKYTIDTIINSKFILIPNIDKELIDKLIDISINLLLTNLVTINNNNNLNNILIKYTTLICNKCL